MPPPLLIMISCTIPIILTGFFTYTSLPRLSSDTILLSVLTQNNKVNTPYTTPSINNNALTGKRYETATANIEVMAWIYPGQPTCDAEIEYSTHRIDILKPEYFTINEEGALVLLTEEQAGCNGYSAKNIASIKNHSKEQYVTLSSSYAVSMDLFLTDALQTNTSVQTLTSFVVANNITGIEIDFEDFGGWNNDLYTKYKTFIQQLGDALHVNQKKLLVIGPATINAEQEAWYVWRYADFVSLPIDRLIIMTYDYQFDQGVGQPVAPLTWVEESIRWTLQKFPNKQKIVVGIPSYGYKGKIGSNKFSLLTFEQIRKEPGFETATRDSLSHEMTWSHGDNVYFYQDRESLAKKLAVIKQHGITSVSVWHLGGNNWFTHTGLSTVE